MLGVANEPRMPRMGFRIKRQPISGVAESGEMLDLLGTPVRQQSADRLLRPRDTHVAFSGGETTRQHFGDPRIKFPQQSRLPAIPDFARDRAHVGDRQDQQQPQALRRLDRVGQIQDSLWDHRCRA